MVNIEDVAASPKALRRLWAKVDKTGNGLSWNGTPCWNWQGSRWSPDGYGRLRMGQRWFSAHRIAYTAIRGSIPGRYVIDHLCRNKGCLNVEHMEPVLERLNVMRGNAPHAINARKTQCVNGHPFDAQNTLRVNGHRRCKTCAEVRNKARQKMMHERARQPMPSFDQLSRDVANLPLTRVGQKYGVTDNAVRKWMQKLGVTRPSGTRGRAPHS